MLRRAWRGVLWQDSDPSWPRSAVRRNRFANGAGDLRSALCGPFGRATAAPLAAGVGPRSGGLRVRELRVLAEQWEAKRAAPPLALREFGRVVAPFPAESPVRVLSPRLARMATWTRRDRSREASYVRERSGASRRRHAESPTRTHGLHATSAMRGLLGASRDASEALTWRVQGPHGAPVPWCDMLYTHAEAALGCRRLCCVHRDLGKRPRDELLQRCAEEVAHRREP